MSYRGCIHVLIFILVLQPLDLFLDWYVLSLFSYHLLLLSLGTCFSDSARFPCMRVTNFSMQVQSLPRMIIKDEIGKQVSDQDEYYLLIFCTYYLMECAKPLMELTLEHCQFIIMNTCASNLFLNIVRE